MRDIVRARAYLYWVVVTCTPMETPYKSADSTVGFANDPNQTVRIPQRQCTAEAAVAAAVPHTQDRAPKIHFAAKTAPLTCRASSTADCHCSAAVTFSQCRAPTCSSRPGSPGGAARSLSSSVDKINDPIRIRCGDYLVWGHRQGNAELPRRTFELIRISLNCSRRPKMPENTSRCAEYTTNSPWGQRIVAASETLPPLRGSHVASGVAWSSQSTG
jgi:hypothetical protein